MGKWVEFLFPSRNRPPKWRTLDKRFRNLFEGPHGEKVFGPITKFDEADEILRRIKKKPPAEKNG